MEPTPYNPRPHLDYYLGEEDFTIEEVAEHILVKYGGEAAYEALKAFFRVLLTQEMLEEFNGFIDLMSSPGNYDFDPYLHGMANGMIFMKSLVDGKEPQYLEAPTTWKSKAQRSRVAGFKRLITLALDEEL